MRNIILTTSCFLIILGSFGQTAILGCGVILAVEDEKLCLDFNETNFSVGARLQVIEHRGFFTHPETGEHNFEEAIIEFTNYRRLIITPITFSINPDPHPLEIFAGTYQVTLCKLSYRINGVFSAGLRWKADLYSRSTKNTTEMQAWDVFGGLNYRFLKILEPFMNIGYSAVVISYNIAHQRTNPKFSERIFLEFGIRIFATDWFSLDFLAPIYPFTSFGGGVSVHMF